MNKENYNIIIECGDYALIDRGHEYVVAYKLNKENMSWAQGHYFSTWSQTQERKLAMLQAATSFMLRKVTDDHSPSEIRFREVAEKCITYVSEQCGEDEVACDLMDELDLSYDEKEYFNV